MFVGISTDLAPPIHRPLIFFLMGIFGGIFTSLYLMNFSINELYRWNTETIILTHVFTIGCVLPIMIGALLQLLPVLFGIKFNYPKLIYSLFVSLPLGLGSFIYGFRHNWLDLNITAHFGLCFLWIMLFIFFGTILYKSIQNILINFKTNIKKITHLGLALFSLNIVLGFSTSVWLILVHLGYQLPIFRPFMTDSHAMLMIIASLFTLICTITSQIIPMFFVTPNFHKSTIVVLIFNSVCIYLNLIFIENESLYFFIKILLAFNLFLYFLQLGYLFTNRKRKLFDPVISHWKLFIINGVLGLVIWGLKNHINTSLISTDYIDSFLGVFIFIGILFPLIIAMLLKIIPFLMWFHLNSLQMEMGNFAVRLPHMKAYVKDQDTKYLLYGFYLLEVGFLTFTPKIWGIITLLITFGFLVILFKALKSFSNGKNSLIPINQ